LNFLFKLKLFVYVSSLKKILEQPPSRVVYFLKYIKFDFSKN